MRISYHKLSVLLAEKSVSKSQLRKDLGFSTSTLTKINQNKIISLGTLCDICDYLDCNIADVCEVVHNKN